MLLLLWQSLFVKVLIAVPRKLSVNLSLRRYEIAPVTRLTAIRLVFVSAQCECVLKMIQNADPVVKEVRKRKENVVFCLRVWHIDSNVIDLESDTAMNNQANQ